MVFTFQSPFFAGLSGYVAEMGSALLCAALGIVLSMELFGMAVGSVLLGSLTDRIGRRPMILFCLVVMALGMFMVPTTTSRPKSPH